MGNRRFTSWGLLLSWVKDRKGWRTREELRIAIITWIERTYHRRRRQARLGRLTPRRIRDDLEPGRSRGLTPQLSPLRAAAPNDIVHQITGDPAEHTEQHPRKGASIEFLKERLTFESGYSDPMAAFQLNMMGAFAQFERELIRQRQAEGIAAAKKRGAYKGRPRSLESDQIRSVRNGVLAGTPEAQIAREHGVSRSTLYRYLGE